MYAQKMYWASLSTRNYWFHLGYSLDGTFLPTICILWLLPSLLSIGVCFDLWEPAEEFHYLLLRDIRVHWEHIRLEIAWICYLLTLRENLKGYLLQQISSWEHLRDVINIQHHCLVSSSDHTTLMNQVIPVPLEL
jgi:hypothetical protein